ncbi:MAG: hypothetical protein IJS70_00595 [Bacteroidales bacterium]|nr:hypothetical protein [Bacteroidales bacterium]MBQ6081643.1 hypothetical protein [Bacteroidales bacterium]MBQ7457648.1 hypothetical protein [Bacteroidales bacterium]MBQ9530250.1 hypothetical protein [Bacteroidales bacterium]
MKTKLKAIFAALLLCLAAGCDNPYEEFSLVQEITPEELRGGYSFDFPMDSGFVYNTAVVCRFDSDYWVKETADITFDVIAPNFETFSETVTFPVVSNVRQKNSLGDGANVLFKRRGSYLDNQWGWRRNIGCDTLPGRWRVIISCKNETDLDRIKAIGFTYKGRRK